MSSRKKSGSPPRIDLQNSATPARSHAIQRHELPAWRYLGIVAAPPASETSHAGVCRLQPLRRWENETWIPIQWNALEPLPVWQDAPLNARPGTLWAFWLEASADQPEEFTEADSGVPLTADDLSVRTLEPPVQIWQVVKQPASAPLSQGKPEARNVRSRAKIAMSPMNAIPPRTPDEEADGIDALTPNEAALCIDDIEAVRVRYVERGETAPPFGPVLALVQDKLLVGPLDLCQGGDGMWRAAPGLVLIRVRPTGKRLVSLSVNGVSCSIYEPGAPLPEAVAEVDFRTNSEALSEALDAVCSEAGGAPLLNTDERSALQKALSLPLLATSDLERAYRFRRFQSALQQVRDSDGAALRWERYVLATPEAQRVISTAAESAKSEILIQMDTQLQAAHRELERIQGECEAESAKLSDTERRLRETEAETVRAESRLTAASDARVAEIAGKVAERMAGRLLDRADGDEPAKPAAQKTVPLDGAAPPVVGQWREAQGEETLTIVEALARLRKRVEAFGLPDECAVALVAAWLTDLVPVIVGDGSALLAQAAADCLAAGRILSAPVTADVVSIADLFGSTHLTTRSYAPHPSGLADVLMATGAGGIGAGTGVIAFAGVNLADSASAFLPLMQAYRSAWESGNAALPLAHPAVLAESDPYEPLCRAVWPRNLLPCFLYADGASPLPPPPAFWRNAALIVAVPTREPAPAKDTRFSAPVPVWDEARQAVRAAARADRFAEGVSVADQRFRGALASLSMAEGELLRLVVLCRRLPLVLSSGGVLTEEEAASLQSCTGASYARAALGGGEW